MLAKKMPKDPTSSKYSGGLIIGLVAFIMISYSGIEGIKMLSTIGGFPILFIMLLVAFGLGRLAFSRKYRERIAEV